MWECIKKWKWSVVFSITAFVFSIGSFFITKEELVIDKVNFFLSILAILVTILIGWQIFNVIQFENRFEKIREQLKIDAENKVNKEITKIYVDVFDMLKPSQFICQTTLFLLKSLHKSKEENISIVLEKVKDLVKSHKEESIFFTPFMGEEERDYLLKEIESLPDNKKQKIEVKELTEILRGLLFFPPF